MPAKRGRPVGYRAPNPRPHLVSVRLSEDERGWLLSRVPSDGNEGDVLRNLIEEARTTETQTTTRIVSDGPITAVDLAAELAAEPGAETAIVEVNGQAERAQAVYWPAIGRGAVAWDADATWSDASSMADLIERVLVTGDVAE